MQDNDLLEKLDQQLYNSKQRFPAWQVNKGDLMEGSFL